MSTNPIDQFVDQLLERAGLSNTTPEKLEEYRINMLKLVQQKLGIEMMKMLPEAAADEFVSLAEKDASSEELFLFFQKNIPDFENKVQDVLKRFELDFEHSLDQFNSLSQGE